MKLIIKQLSKKGAPTVTGTLHRFDFCISKAWGTTDDWLINNKFNGYSHKETNGFYTKFKLELIK